MRRLLAAVALGLAAPAVAGPPKLAPPPPYIAAYTPTTVDERGLWQQLDEEERILRDAPDVIRDPALTSYVRGVLCRTVGQERCAPVRLYIQHLPEFNAYMAPNGMMVVYTGMLLRVRNEAELAAVLGHEFGHFELRHSLARFRSQRTTGDILAWTGILAPQQYSNLQPTLWGLHFANTRAQETEADMFGLRFLTAAGYRPLAASDVWRRLMAEEDATAIGRKRTSTHRYAAGMFATHPTELARAQYLEEQAGPDGDQGDDNSGAFERALAPWRARFLTDQIKLNDFGGSEYLLGQLAGAHWPSDLLFARGELYRERGHPRDLVSAASFYQQAIDAGCTDPAAWRGLGLALTRNGQTEPGRAALATYLARAPDAKDRAVVQMLIGQGEAK